MEEPGAKRPNNTQQYRSPTIQAAMQHSHVLLTVVELDAVGRDGVVADEAPRRPYLALELADGGSGAGLVHRSNHHPAVGCRVKLLNIRHYPGK
jgi:hypothetical protein